MDVQRENGLLADVFVCPPFRPGRFSPRRDRWSALVLARGRFEESSG